ncbi:acetyl-CoA carboxylase carboxyltransferase subunit alpha/beta [Streptomyces sp. WAC 00631]|uniref:carboxyl transferase domain-containing protein n=1 Tax=Streptomyces sp. WAC 00631 TaxID=2203201 RepID=UPI000F78B732|nr:carboxyl transferase domain-containing protein [Streptomyces sp. WAC 00631]MCC5034267.1 acetyl-CoA carboxylase carboxyltransferase subunit alpha/beta [Streptomyces sp. WAC 00631]
MTGPSDREPVLQLIEAVLDGGSWRTWDEPVPVTTRDPGYRADLERARERTGLDESVITGEGRIRGRRVAVVACEFRFLAGSIGVAAGERLVRAVERATAERLPLLAAPASGGTRMQEGTVAFVQMVKVTAAIAGHKAAGLPYLVYLRHPTTGGVLASWGSLGHLTAAEPGALIGFLGPRVHQALYGEEFPPGVQTAENLLAHGLVDAVLPARGLPAVVADALDVLCDDTAGTVPPPLSGPEAAGPAARADGGPGAPAARGPRRDPAAADGARASAVTESPAGAGPEVPATAVSATADSIRRSRRPGRPGVRALLKAAGRQVTPLSGTGAGEHDPGLLLALARIGGTPCVVLGHDRHDGAAPPLGPGGLREARRGMRIAAELGLPLLTVVDTAGAALSREAEEGGLAAEIARSLADLVTLPAPTLCLLLGQGAGGGALALLPADRVLAAEHAWLSPLPPEGASAILHRTTERADEVAAQQGVRSADLLAHGIVDRVVAEPGPSEPGPGSGSGPDAVTDAADDPGRFLTHLGEVLGRELALLRAERPEARLAARRLRHRTLGVRPLPPH